MKRALHISSALLALTLVFGCSKKESEATSTAEGAEATEQTHADEPAREEATGAHHDKAAAADQNREGMVPPPPDVAAAPADAQRTASGLASKVLQPGNGTDHPRGNDQVTVHYTGWTTDGMMFDSSVQRGEPVQFGLNQVIDGWTEGVQLMVKGEKRRFWIPARLAYEGRPGPQGTLVFDVELLDFERAPEPPAVPDDVARIPRNAKKTPSGLASRVLQRGTGTRKPAPTSRVEVHYSGWTTDGQMFDSSVTRGQPATFPLNRVIPGWSEGLQLMVEGEKRRLWIPASLAYEGSPGRPQGMLVFDVELIRIVD